MKKIILLILILMMMIMGCQKPANEESTNLFHPKEVKVGDKVANMEIVKLEVGQDAPNYTVFATFEGKKIVKGKFVQYEDHEFLGNAISFEVNEEESDILPRLSYDQRNIWFAFRNREEAIKLLEGYNNEGVTIEIVDYTIKYAYTEVVNEASISRVIEGVKRN